MRRRVPNLSAALSLLMWPAACVLFLWGLLFKNPQADIHSRLGGRSPAAYFTPGSLHVRLAPGYEVDTPLWAVAVLCAVTPPLIRDWKTWRRARLGREGRCSRCGYDLRVTPGRCPECGTGAAPCTLDPALARVAVGAHEGPGGDAQRLHWGRYKRCRRHARGIAA